MANVRRSVLSLERTPAAVAEMARMLPIPCIVATDAAGFRLYRNPALYRLLGVPDDFNFERRGPSSADPALRFFQGGRALARNEFPLFRALKGGTAVCAAEAAIVFDDERVVRVIVAADPIFDESGTLLGAVASLVNITDAYARVHQEHAWTRSELHVARQTERRSTDRLRFLAELGQTLGESLDLQAIFRMLGSILVPRFADSVLIAITGEDAGVESTFLHDGDSARKDEIAQLRRELAIDNAVLAAGMGLGDTGRGTFCNDIRTIAQRQPREREAQYVTRLAEQFGLLRSIVVPMSNRGTPIGTLVALARADRVYAQDDVHFLEEIARRAAIAVDNARSFEYARHLAGTLQQALLPARLPQGRDIAFSAHYAPSDDKARIGGDWYDALELPDGRIVASIGDVTGRGIEAAVIMGKVRQAIGTLAFAGAEPQKILAAADLELRRLYPDTIVTAFVGTFDMRRGILTYANAGHPPPFLLTTDKAVLPLPAHGLPLGLRTEEEPAATTFYLQKGAKIVFFTDGLVESTRDFAEGERRVRGALRRMAAAREPVDAKILCERVLYDGSHDDVAVMVADIQSAAVDTLHWQFNLGDVRLSHELRQTFVEYLRQIACKTAPVAAAEVVLGELIGNAVQHARGLVDIEIDWRAESAVFTIVDGGGGYEGRSALPGDPLSETGRGLFLVRQLAAGLTVTRLPGYGSHTRVVLDLRKDEAR